MPIADGGDLPKTIVLMSSEGKCEKALKMQIEVQS